MMNDTDDGDFDESMLGTSERSETTGTSGSTVKTGPLAITRTRGECAGVELLREPVAEEMTEPEFQRLSSVEPLTLEWIWEGVLPRGKLACLFGEPGVGKSLVAAQLVAMVTRGWTCPPQGAPSAVVPPGGVVLLSSFEEGLANTIRPQVAAAGADLDLVFIPRDDRQSSATAADEHGADEAKCTDSPVSDVARLRRSLRRIEANLGRLKSEGVEIKLIVIDSIDQYVSSVSKVVLKSLIAELVTLAERSGAAVLVVSNVSSLSLVGVGTSNCRWRIDEFANAARAVLMVAQYPGRRARRIVLPVKLNFSGKPAGRVFTIESGVVRWRSQKVPFSVHEYFRQVRMRARHPLPREEMSELRRAMQWLKESLSNGPISSGWLQSDASCNDISYATLRRAYARLGCRSVRKRGSTRWYWRLPETTYFSICSTLGTENMTQRSHEIDGRHSVVQAGSGADLGHVAHQVAQKTSDEQLENPANRSQSWAVADESDLDETTRKSKDLERTAAVHEPNLGHPTHRPSCPSCSCSADGTGTVPRFVGGWRTGHPRDDEDVGGVIGESPPVNWNSNEAFQVT